MKLLLQLSIGAALAAGGQLQAAASADEDLPAPSSLTLDASLPRTRADAAVLAARRFYAFWNTGDGRYLAAAIAPGFTDRTLPKGRPQGPDGPAFASKGFRAAVPDLRCEIRQLIVAGDRVVAHLRFTGHFTGAFAGKRGSGQVVDFIATDILRIADGRVVDNWHIEDNLTLMQQLGQVGTN
ncbi:MAG TPA: ester cyclase [Candidatus Limnocylindrales bacterium]|nr:ester cyclase [Candidatus Limnocylindrales bacterium]